MLVALKWRAMIGGRHTRRLSRTLQAGIWLGTPSAECACAEYEGAVYRYSSDSKSGRACTYTRTPY